MENKEIVVYLDNEAKFELLLKKEDKIKDIKYCLSSFLKKDLYMYNIRLFINQNSEVDIFTTNKYDNKTLKSIWNNIEQPQIFLTKKIENMSKDVLFLLALKMNVLDLLKFCETNKRINQICNSDNIWYRKLNEQYYNYDVSLKQETPKQTYILLYYLEILIDKFKLSISLTELYNLQELDLSSKELKNIPKEIKVLINLKELYFNYNEIEEIPKEISFLTNLEVLDFEENIIQEIPKEIGHLINLEDLIISENKIKKIPKEIGLLYNLKELNLSSNLIEEIPKNITSLIDLEKLILSSNKIKKIPKEIGLMIGLKILDLSDNQIDDIPQEISSLENLENLDLMHNKIKNIIKTKNIVSGLKPNILTIVFQDAN